MRGAAKFASVKEPDQRVQPTDDFARSLPSNHSSVRAVRYRKEDTPRERMELLDRRRDRRLATGRKTPAGTSVSRLLDRSRVVPLGMSAWKTRE